MLKHFKCKQFTRQTIYNISNKLKKINNYLYHKIILKNTLAALTFFFLQQLVHKVTQFHRLQFVSVVQNGFRFAFGQKVCPAHAPGAQDRFAPGEVHHGGQHLHDDVFSVHPRVLVAPEELLPEFLEAELGGEAGRQHRDVVDDVFHLRGFPLLPVPVNVERQADQVREPFPHLFLLEYTAVFVNLKFVL